VQSIVTTDIESRISTISQQILSRSNLEAIIQKFGLFSDPKYSGMFLEDMVAMARERIEVKVNRADRRSEADAFSISFKGSDPETVQRVTNELAGSFINENLKTREAQAVGTSDFLADELQLMQKRLVETEEKLREYRRTYMGELPEQLDANLRALERLQLQLSERQKTLREEKARLITIESQIEINKKYLTDNQSPVISEQGDVSSLEQLKGQLANLKSNYTDQHPDVIKLQARIAELEAQYKSGGLSSPQTSTVNASADPATRMISRTMEELIRQRGEAIGEIKNIDIDVANLVSQMKQYQERVEKTPKREQELLSLNRDYENIQESYKSLLNRKLEAEIAVNMEKKQKGEQFRIVDRASLPQKPVSPDMRKLILLCVAGGIGVGAGLIFLLEFFNTSLKNSKDYESELGLVVLTTIPRLYSTRDKILGRVNQVLTIFSIIVAAALTAGFAVLVIKGVNPVLEIARQYIKI